MPRNIIIADDHPIYRNAMVQTLTTMLPKINTFEVSSIKELNRILVNLDAGCLLILDLHMPRITGFEGLAYVSQNYPHTSTIMISADEDPYIAPLSKRYGAKGFIPKSAKIPFICDAVNAVLNGNEWFPDHLLELPEMKEVDILTEKVSQLTSRQIEAFNLLANGLLNKQIAFEMNVTEATVKAHLTGIMRKLNVNNRTEVMLIANKINIDQFNS